MKRLLGILILAVPVLQADMKADVKSRTIAAVKAAGSAVVCYYAARVAFDHFRGGGYASSKGLYDDMTQLGNRSWKKSCTKMTARSTAIGSLSCFSYYMFRYHFLPNAKLVLGLN